MTSATAQVPCNCSAKNNEDLLGAGRAPATSASTRLPGFTATVAVADDGPAPARVPALPLTKLNDCKITTKRNYCPLI